MDETVVMDESRVEGDAIGVECDCGELEVQGIVVPFVITYLGGGGKVRARASQLLALQGTSPNPAPCPGDGTVLYIPSSTSRAAHPAQGIASLSKICKAGNLL